MSYPIRWSGPVILSDQDCHDYDCKPGSLYVWAGEADGSGHVDEDASAVLEDHDATGRPGTYDCTLGPISAAWLKRALDDMSQELGLKPGYLH